MSLKKISFNLANHGNNRDQQGELIKEDNLPGGKQKAPVNYGSDEETVPLSESSSSFGLASPVKFLSASARKDKKPLRQRLAQLASKSVEEKECNPNAHLIEVTEDAVKNGCGEVLEEEVGEEEYDYYAYLTQEPDDAEKYGYGDEKQQQQKEEKEEEKEFDYYAHLTAEPEDPAKYGYGDEASPTPRRATMDHHTKTPRRSSMKGSSGPKTSKRRGSLTFKENVEVSTITPARDLTKKPSKLWFEEKDYAKMQNEVDFIAECALDGLTNDKMCTRGLEDIMSAESVNRKYFAWDAVLDEQFKQWDAGETYDGEALSKSYKRVSDESMKLATSRALQDAKEVEEYLAETRRYCRRMSM